MSEIERFDIALFKIADVLEPFDDAEAAEILCHALGSVIATLGNREAVLKFTSERVRAMAARADVN